MMMAVVEFRLRDGMQQKFEQILSEMQNRITHYDGYLGELACKAISDPARLVTLFLFEHREALEAWRDDAAHLDAQTLGRNEVFSWYQITVATVERRYEFTLN
jgi:heme-degrading monooxygenase HmoA